MAILNTILAVKEPTGMWETIIKAFEGAMGSYILAIILLTIILRIIWSPIDTFNKRISSKMTAVQAKMQPELNKIQEKYGNNPQLLKQKQNEVYKKYNGNTMGSCLFMLAFMALNLTIFLTLWSGLNSMATFKISEHYENLKYEYANCLDITQNYIKESDKEVFKDYKNLSFETYYDVTEQKQKIRLVHYLSDEHSEENKEVLFSQDYKKDFSVTEGEEISSNAYIVNLINTYITPEEEDILINEEKEGETVTVEGLTLSTAIKDTVDRAIGVKYEETKESFLWIKNIWVADSPFQKSIFDFKAFKGIVGAKNLGENEELIYNTIIGPLKQNKDAVNGYFLLAILCVITSLLSILLSRGKRKGNPQPQTGGIAMMIIMPLIFGLFAIFYNAVFAIYMAISQLISALLIPLQNLIVDKWQKHDENKKKAKVEVAEYSRKF